MLGVIISFIEGAANKIVLAVLIFLLGFIVGKSLERLIIKLLAEIEFNLIIRRATGYRFDIAKFAARAVSLSSYFLSLVAALNQLGVVNTLLVVIQALIVALLLFIGYILLRDFIPNVFYGFMLRREGSIKQGNLISKSGVKGTIVRVTATGIHVETKKKDMLVLPYSLLR